MSADKSLSSKEKRSLERAFAMTSDWSVHRPDQYYADVWSRDKLDSLRMGAYREMESSNQIWIDKVSFNKVAGIVVIEYRSTIPHEWILDEMKKMVESVSPKFPQVEQLVAL